MKTYSAQKGNNPNYWLHLACRGHGFEVIADLPEELSIGVTSEWESRLPYSLSKVLDGGVVLSGIANAVAYMPEAQFLSYQMWMGSTPIEIPMMLLFDAKSSAREDVYEPINLILAAAQAVNGIGGMLHPPGPRYGLGYYVGDDYGIDIKIGRNLMTFKDCILVSATETFDTRLDAEGFPIAGQVECTFRTSIVYGHQDWMEAANLKGVLP